MKKIKIFTFISFLSFATALPGCVSCSQSNAEEKTIYGGSVNLSGSSIGVDTYGWRAMINGKNFSSSVIWETSPLLFGIFLKYDSNNDCVFLHWSNLSSGIYTFCLKATIPWDKNNTFLSPNIVLHVSGSSVISGGTHELKYRYMSGEDEKPWSAIYNGIDYSKDAKWAIENKTIPTANIFINYIDEKHGAIVSWKNLSMQQYIFLVKCTFKPESSTEEVTFYSDEIYLTVSKYDYITISGGTHYINATCSKSGQDKKALKCFLNDSFDVSINTRFSISYDKNWGPNDIFIFTNEKSEKYLSWSNAFDIPITISFKVSAQYDQFVTTSIDYFFIVFE